MENEPSRHPREKSPTDVLQQLTGIFASKGWLTRELRIRYHDKRYRISCNEERFFAYRINENCGLPPGVPGWPVCIVSQDYIFDESGISDLTPTKLSIQDWLNIIANDDFELI